MDTLIGAVSDGWEQEPLASVCELSAGLSGNRTSPSERFSGDDRPEGALPLVTARDIRNRRVAEVGTFWEAGGREGKLTRYRAAAGDIVGTRNGVLGRFGVVGEALAGAVVDSGLILLRPGDRVRSAYLVHYLALPAVGDWIERNSTGTAVPTISARSLGALPVVLPPLPVQDRIGAALAMVSDKIELHEEIAVSARELRETLAPLLITGAVGPER